MKPHAVGFGLFLGSFVVSANIRPPPCAGEQCVSVKPAAQVEAPAADTAADAGLVIRHGI